MQSFWLRPCREANLLHRERKQERQRDCDGEIHLTASKNSSEILPKTKAKEKLQIYYQKPLDLTESHKQKCKETHKHDFFGLQFQEILCYLYRQKWAPPVTVCPQLQSDLVRKETTAKYEAYSHTVFLSDESLSTVSIWTKIGETERVRKRKKIERPASQGLTAHSSWPEESPTVTVHKHSWFMILLWLWFNSCYREPNQSTCVFLKWNHWQACSLFCV